MNLKPIGDRVLIKLIKDEKITTSGIIISSSQNRDENYAKIIELGHGDVVESLKKQGVKQNDSVYFFAKDFTQIVENGETFYLIDANNIVGKLDEVNNG